MVNEVVANFIPLAGRGYVKKRHGGFQQGEYKMLHNVLFRPDGVIEPRPSAVSLGGIFRKPQYFFGHWSANVMVMRDGEQYVMGKDLQGRLWSLSGMQEFLTSAYTGDEDDDSAAVMDLKMIGFFTYNDAYWWIVQLQCDFGHWHHYTVRADAILGGGYIDIRNYTDTTDLTAYHAFTNARNQFSNYMGIGTYWTFHKDRLWIADHDTAHYSGATDPGNWVEGSGSFRLPNRIINDIVSLGDNIYVICDDAIYMITYATDPGLAGDAQQILLSDSVGGDSAVIYGNEVYFIRNDALYRISNGSVSKALDLDLELNATDDSDSSQLKLYAYDRYLIVMDRGRYRYPFLEPTYQYERTYFANKNITTQDPTGFKPYIFWIDMELGVVSVFDFKDQIMNPGAAALKHGSPMDFMYIPVESEEDKTNLWFMTLNRNHYTNYATESGTVYRLRNSTDPDERYIDEVQEIDYSQLPTTNPFGTPQSFVRYNIIDSVVEIDSYCPDGFEYMMKKFRHLLVSANWPDEPEPLYQLELAYGDRDYSIGFDLRQDEALDLDDTRPPNPFRYGLNQRGRSISLKFSGKLRFQYLPDIPLYNAGWSIHDIRMFWSYTARGPVRKQFRNDVVNI